MSEPQRKRRICCFCERWESGGIESFLYNVLTRIDLTRLRIDIVVSDLGKSIFTEPLQKRGVNFFELSGSQQKVLENYQRFRILLRNRRYDVLQLNAFHGLSLAYLRIARRMDVPIRIAHSHNTALRKTRTQHLKLAVHGWAKERYTADATDLWACSQAAAEFLFSKHELERGGFQFIPNGIDTERFRFDSTIRDNVRRELGLDGKFVIGNVGRLCYQKNQAFLIDIFAEVQRQRPESCLLLLGEGEDKPSLKEKARRLGIEEKVVFLGVIDQVERLLWAMDAFIFPSRFEGLGIAVIEAQTAGLPVLCSEYVPPEAEVTNLFRQLSLSAGAEQWAKRVLEMSGRISDRVEDVKAAGFDIAQTAEKIQALYER